MTAFTYTLQLGLLSKVRGCILRSRHLTSQRCDEWCPNSKDPPNQPPKCVQLLPGFEGSVWHVFRQDKDSLQDMKEIDLSQDSLQAEREIFVPVTVATFTCAKYL